MSPDGDMLYPFLLINSMAFSGVHHNHKYWELELVLDTDYLEDTTAPTQYWAYYLDVQTGVVEGPAIQCNDDWNWIEWFKVYIREADGTQTCLTYAEEDLNVLWCVGEVNSFSNEIGTRHQTKTFKFICLKGREKTYTAVTRAPGTHGYANEGPVKYMEIANMNIPTKGFCTNILSFEDEFVTNMMPQFMPNTFQGLDMKQDQHWRVLTFVIDSECDVFDDFVNITTANLPIPANFYVTFTLADGAATAEQWTYTTSLNYILARNHGKVDDDVQRDTFEYKILTQCDKTITHP